MTLSQDPKKSVDKKNSKSHINSRFTLFPIFLFPALLLIRFPIGEAAMNQAYVASLPLGLLTLLLYRSVAPYLIHQKKAFYSIYIILLVFISFPFRFFAVEVPGKQDYHPINKTESSQLVSELIDGNLSNSFPHKNLLFISLASFLVASLLYLRRLGKLLDLREVVLAAICSLAIFLITWKNTSWGSPYSWVPTLERAKADEYTYVVSHFSNGQGLVNADEFVNTSMLNLFNANAYENLMLIRRPIAYYFVSQLSGVLNPYYIWISFNLISWILAAASTYFLLKMIGFEFLSRAAATLLVSVFPLSAAYVGQTAPYFLNTLLSIFITFFFVLFQRYLRNKSVIPLILFCVMASLIYDVYFWIFFLSIAAVRLRFIKKLDALMLVTACGSAPFLYSLFFSRLTATPIPDTNSSQIGNAISGVITILTNLDLQVLQSELIETFSNSLFVVLSLLTPLIASFFVLISMYLFWQNHTFREFSREWLIFIGFGFFIFQTIFAISNHREIGTIPRVNSFILVFFVILLSELNSRTRVFSPTSILAFAVSFYLLLLDLRLVPGWTVTMFNLVQGGWLPFAFN